MSNFHSLATLIAPETSVKDVTLSQLNLFSCLDAELLVLRQELLSKEEQLQKAGDRVAELTKQLTEVRKLPHGKRLESESDSFKKYTKLKEEVAVNNLIT